MSLQSIIETQVAAMRHQTFMDSPQLSLGELIERLEAIETEDDCSVRFDFGYFRPSELMSWRGVYAELAVGFTDKGDYKDPQLSKFITELKGAIGKTYTGYKGGDFFMSKSTPVWVANYGESGNTAVVGVTPVGRDKAYKVIINTAYCES